MKSAAITQLRSTIATVWRSIRGTRRKILARSLLAAWALSMLLVYTPSAKAAQWVYCFPLSNGDWICMSIPALLKPELPDDCPECLRKEFIDPRVLEDLSTLQLLDGLAKGVSLELGMPLQDTIQASAAGVPLPAGVTLLTNRNGENVGWALGLTAADGRQVQVAVPALFVSEPDPTPWTTANPEPQPWITDELLAVQAAQDLQYLATMSVVAEGLSADLGAQVQRAIQNAAASLSLPKDASVDFIQ